MTGLRQTVRGAGVLLLGLAAAQACGPDFRADVFVRANRPDLPAEYPKGKLGLLRPTFPRADLLVAYRYLSGGTLDAEEQKGWQPTYDDDEPEWEQEAQQEAAGNYGRYVLPGTAIAAWVLARNEYPDAPPGPIGQFRVMRVPVGSGSYEADYLNCGEDAFRTATSTLADRAARWGQASAALKDWLRAQDAVFSNCRDGRVIPEKAPAGSPALLIEDRAYQTAAAEFYSGDYAAAGAAFAAISQDPASPWKPFGGYLVARVLVRRAFLQGMDPAKEINEYDPAWMKQAGDALRAYLATTPPPPHLQRAAAALLALVRIRSDGEARVRELAALVGGTGPGTGHDPNYKQDAIDLLWYVNAKTPEGLRARPVCCGMITDAAHPGQMLPETPEDVQKEATVRRHEAYAATEGERALSPVIDWAITFASLDPAASAHALAEWRQTHAVPWLVAALALAPEGEATPDLLKAAAAVPESSAAWQTVRFHRARLLIAAGRPAEARAVLGSGAESVTAEPSSVNAFRGLALRASPTLAEFVTYVPRTVLLRTSEEEFALAECRDVMKDPKRHYNCIPEPSPTEMDADAAGVLNSSAPLAVWAQVARAGSLPDTLRQVVAQAGWTRAVLLKDAAAARVFLPLLPPALREQAGAGGEIGFGEQMALVRNPGLTPYLNGGTQRGYSWDFVQSFRENWCYKPPAEPAGSAAFLTTAEKAEGARQARALGGVSAATLGRELVEQVRAHADEPRAAEALYLVLRMVRYGCVEARAPVAAAAAGSSGDARNAMMAGPPPTAEEAELYRLKMDAARLLRQRYAASPWTKKASPFAG